MFSRCGIKVAEGFPIISNLAVTTRITINYFRASLFMASFDIKSLFGNILQTETLNLCV